MHLQINLSNQLIKQWKPELTASPPETHPLFRWRLDKIRIDRTTANYICVNEESLFSFLLLSLPGKKAFEIQKMFVHRLDLLLLDFSFPRTAREMLKACDVLHGKTSNPKVIGCVTNMRQLYESHFFNLRSLEEAERFVNQTPFQGPNYRIPIEEFLKLHRVFWNPPSR